MYLQGKAAEAFLDERIAEERAALLKALAPLAPVSATLAWLDTLRAIEEFINLPFASILDDELFQTLLDLPLQVGPCHEREAALMALANEPELGPGEADRFGATVLQLAAIAHAFRRHGLIDPAIGLATVGSAIAYLQSRRRHIVALLYTLPAACRGERNVARLDSFNVFLPLVELRGLSITTLHHQAMLARAHSDYELTVDNGRLIYSTHDYETLDTYFLDPERAALTEMDGLTADAERPGLYEPYPTKLFSATEARNTLVYLAEAYREFHLDETAYGPMAKALKAMLDRAEDDYFIVLKPDDLNHILTSVEDLGQARAALFANGGEDYVANTNEFAPFIQIGEEYHSTVTLIERFAVHWKNRCLGKSRRFQIRAGFIFEESVKRALREQGFEVSDVRRIDRREFDVLALKDGILFNIQCKNNLVDLTKLEAEREKFVRYNRRLDGYYRRALAKEAEREHVLRERFGVERIEHVVLTRFPVVTTNPQVFSFAKIERFSEWSAALRTG